jgi:ABC-type phosphate/phosphonate transport system substrate-binding protein
MKKVLIVLTAIIFSLSTLHASEKKDVLNIAYYLPSMKNNDAKDIKISLEFWAKELSLQTDIKMNSFFYKNINNLKEDFDAGNIDVVAASSLVFIQYFDPSTLTDGFKSIGKDNEGQNRLLLIVQKNAKIKNLKDLKYKKIVRLNSDLEELYLNSQLQKDFKKDTDQFFKKNIIVKKYSKAILKLFFKKADVALVTEAAFNLASEMNPQIKKRLKIIKKADLQLISSSYFRKGVDKKKIQTFKEQAFKIHKTKRGAQILTVFKSDRVVESKLEELDSVKKIYEEYIALKK